MSAWKCKTCGHQYDGPNRPCPECSKAEHSFDAPTLFCFRWWYKGRTVEGNTMKLEGRVVARDASEACDRVEKQMRAEHPTTRWMQGKEIEGDGVTFGPTVQKRKTPVEAAKQND